MTTAAAYVPVLHHAHGATPVWAVLLIVVAALVIGGIYAYETFTRKH